MPDYRGHRIQESQTSQLNFTKSKSLPSRQEGKNVQGGAPVHAKHRSKKRTWYVLVT